MRLHQFGLFPEEITTALRVKHVEAILETLTGELHFVISCLLDEWKEIGRSDKIT